MPKQTETTKRKKRKPLYQVPVLKSGWTIWQAPKMNGYIMGCCDCGLRHKMKFEVFLAGVDKKDYVQVKKVLKGKKYRIRMKAKRHD
jgi:hypothetical protein